MNTHEVETHRINLLRQSISEQLHELSSIDTPDSRALVVKRLVALAIEACAHVQAATQKYPAESQALAQGMTHWPVCYSLFPGDVKGLKDHIRKLGLAASPPITVRTKTKPPDLSSPGTKWAFAYWQLVTMCQAHHDVTGSKPAPVTAADAKDAVALPRLSKDPEVIKQWIDAYERHLDRHFPENSFVDHPDWIEIIANRHSVRDMRAKVIYDVTRGFRSIAPQV